MPKKQQKGRGGWLFLGLVLAGYGLFYLVKPDEISQALTFFTHVMRQVLPVLGIVFLLLFISNLLLKPKWIKRYLGKESGTKGWGMAVLGGILSIGPVYVWYEVLAELKTKGMRTALVATFLYSRAVKLPLLPLMIYYFGLTYTLVLCLYLVVFSVINGILIERLMPSKT
ncbi:hypothetical protein BOW37_12490 [Solemya velum gill symbiont]|uniref:hypothetical protein n=1 Tax=Solemya velum gill symbiont TaxID=2340 RepID=UPI0009960976|nr:hypothetical protein [Solemya velum gill symbiont]OOZ42991.1 hypothetical protein BOW37_12490 [Solemya velum gill symbiont]OOZ56649.1 hypothetical protein BOW42_06000 [Solemya velum gill symbiont]OOZ69662.1 hypothetical protein BOW48_11995 [Solemya velum gill symbiont]OOZ75720.1 hypothetical protein BOW50_11110 [Solemya velum gill symbiont]